MCCAQSLHRRPPTTTPTHPLHHSPLPTLKFRESSCGEWRPYPCDLCTLLIDVLYSVKRSFRRRGKGACTSYGYNSTASAGFPAMSKLVFTSAPFPVKISVSSLPHMPLSPSATLNTPTLLLHWAFWATRPLKTKMKQMQTQRPTFTQRQQGAG